MNHSIPPGSHGPPPALPVHAPRRDYHAYHHHQPQSPIPHTHNPYANYHPQYYGHAPQPQYRWPAPYQQQQQHYVPPPHIQQQYQPRSPMVVSSQPYAPAMTPVARQQNPMPPPTPQSTHSPRPVPQYMHQQVPAASPSPAPASTPAPVQKVEEARVETPPYPAQPARRPSTARDPLLLPPEYKQPYWPPELPWYSTPEGRTAFPSRVTPRRRRRRNIRAPTEAVAMPTPGTAAEEVAVPARTEPNPEPVSVPTVQEDCPPPQADEALSETSTIAVPSEPETPATSQAPSESDFTQVSTPATPAQPTASSPKPAVTQQHARRDTRTAIAVPNILGLPKARGATPPATASSEAPKQADENITPKTEEQQAVSTAEEAAPKEEPELHISPPKPAVKSWADLVKRNTKPALPTAPGVINGEVITNGVQLPKSASLADALKQYNVQSDMSVPFLQPRGFENRGNLCYMNSVLQVLVFCVPFYNFLDQIRQRTVHSLKSDTPLIDAMVEFMSKFKVLASAESVGQLRAMLKPEQLEAYGISFAPKGVYEVVEKLPRFANMRRGNQEDAEEFLGFLLEGLHDECVHVMQGQAHEKSQVNGISTPDAVSSPTQEQGWEEVGRKQRSAITRTEGQQDAPSPITKIFGGTQRSELRKPQTKDSVTFTPFRPLQLDIDDQHIGNITDALRGLTKVETMDFGKGVIGKKQVFIDALPPVLVLHLKRFQYDNVTNTTHKIWKKVGYPLELEIPKEIFSPAKRGGLAVKGGAPKYRLTSVVYHHGKFATGGHYTVDVLRQDSREWIRMNDTVIQRIRPEDVAEGGSEEDPKILAKALEQHKADQDLQKQRNMYQGLDEAEKEPEEEKPWNEVNGQANGHAKKFSTSVGASNGTATPTSTTGKRTPTAKKDSVRDNKVAYILLYERIRD